jgi:hypothetical protein
LSGPSSPIIQFESIRFTPEVLAAREAHFRAYDNAARLAANTDINPALLMQLYRDEADRAQASMHLNNLYNLKASTFQAASTATNLKADSTEKTSFLLSGERKVVSIPHS